MVNFFFQPRLVLVLQLQPHLCCLELQQPLHRSSAVNQRVEDCLVLLMLHHHLDRLKLAPDYLALNHRRFDSFAFYLL